MSRPEHAKAGAGIGQLRLSALGCQLWLASSSVEGAVCAGLPGMSLAFALMAAINGSTGSCATLSHGLKRPHQASPASARRRQGFSLLMGWRRKGPPGTLLNKPGKNSLFQRWWEEFGQNR